MMLTLLLVAAPTQATQTMVAPAEVRPTSRPLFEVACELRDLNFSKSYRVILSQYGGIYSRAPGANWGGRSPTYVRVTRDDLGIFGDSQMDMTGHKITDWYSDGPFELTAQNGARGGYTFYKTAGTRASWDSPTKIAVTVKGGRFVSGVAPEATIEEFLLVGNCDVVWKEQEAALPTSEKGRQTQ